MDLLNKLIEDFFAEVIGKDVFEVYKLLKGKEPVSEFKLAEKLKITVNQTRNMLYRLYSHSLVDFIRKKDKKKGWYIYYWEFNLKRALGVALDYKQERVNALKALLEREQNSQHFSCKDCEIRLSFEQAIENDYKCPECDKVLERDNNVRKIQRLQKTISELEEEIAKGKGIEIPEKKIREEKPKKKRKVKRKVTKKRKPIKKKFRKRVVRRKKPARKKPKKRAAKRGAAKKKKSSSKISKRKKPKKISKRKVAKKKSVKKKLRSKRKRITRRRKNYKKRTRTKRK